MTEPLTDERHDGLEQARQLGHLRAERLDLTLRTEEQREREMRFVRLTGEGGGGAPPPAEPGGLAGSEVWRLQQEVERLAAFHRAVLQSRAWRVVQWARRPFGRAW